MACPFFSPTERAENIALPHPTRLPLGAAWRGGCGAPGFELIQLSEKELESCNLGYAHTCSRLPAERDADAVRFVVAKVSPERLIVQFVVELRHLPVASGQLEYDRALNRWASLHSNPRIQKLANCFLQSCLERNASEPVSA